MNKILFFLLIFLNSGIMLSQKVAEFKILKYPNGGISSKGFMRDAKPDGFWITYYPNGIKKSEGLRNNFLLDSVWIFFDEKGDTLEKINYVLGKKNGFYYTFCWKKDIGLNKNYLCSKELFVNDSKEGNSFYYFENGNIYKKINYSKGKINGTCFEFDKSGRVILIDDYINDIIINRDIVNRVDADGRKQGKWVELFVNGKIKKEENYKDDLLNGLYKEFDDKGQLTITLRYNLGKLIENTNEDSAKIEIKQELFPDGKVKYAGPFKNDVPIGIHRNFDEDGKIVGSILYNDFGEKLGVGIINEKGERIGKWVNYYKNGSILSEGNYINNLASGKWSFFNQNGKLEQIGYFLSGKETSRWIWYNDSGSVRREEEYLNGKEEGECVEYSEKGDTLEKGEYLDGDKVGVWYYKVGDLVEVGGYSAGLKDGSWKGYYLNGILMYEGSYIQGNANGKFKFFKENGKLNEERSYTMGKRDGIWKVLDDEGNQIHTVVYKDDVEIKINGSKVTYNNEPKKVK